jgi:hypothetical protein
LFTWQVAQATVACAPVSGNDVVLWLNVALVQFVVEWQVAHVVGKPTAA